MNMDVLALAQQTKRRNESRLIRMNNVVAVGIGYKTTGGVRTNEIAVVVSVVKKLPLVQLPEGSRVPQVLGGVETDVVETGLIFAQQDPT
jgi:hypothetical protein